MVADIIKTKYASSQTFSVTLNLSRWVSLSMIKCFCDVLVDKPPQLHHKIINDLSELLALIMPKSDNILMVGGNIFFLLNSYSCGWFQNLIELFYLSLFIVYSIYQLAFYFPLSSSTLFVQHILTPISKEFVDHLMLDCCWCSIYCRDQNDLKSSLPFS